MRNDVVNVEKFNDLTGGYRFIIVMKKLNWRRIRKEMEEVQVTLKATSEELDEVTKERDALNTCYWQMKESLKMSNDHISWLEEDAAKGRKHDEEFVKVIEQLTEQVFEANVGRGNVKSREQSDMDAEYMKGVKDCCEAICKRYPEIDRTWLECVSDMRKVLRNNGYDPFETPKRLPLGSPKI